MMSVRDALRRTFYGATPRPALDAYLRARMRREAARLVALRERGGEGPAALVDELMRSHFFRPLQRRSEFLRLWELVGEERPRAVCEIGAAGGGTAFLFAAAAAPDAILASVDLAFGAARRACVGRFARRAQQIVCVEGDSHRPATLDAVRLALQGRPLDLLYLDGDHSYEGVAADFQMYAPLVRPGGLVVFHDIVLDYRARYGVETSSDTGGVPRFWQEAKSSGAHVEEIIEDEGQDGFGVGVLRLPRADVDGATGAGPAS
jgi:predicted O-methyltransferase YrrM